MWAPQLANMTCVCVVVMWVVVVAEFQQITLHQMSMWACRSVRLRDREGLCILRRSLRVANTRQSTTKSADPKALHGVASTGRLVRALLLESPKARAGRPAAVCGSPTNGLTAVNRHIWRSRTGGPVHRSCADFCWEFVGRILLNLCRLSTGKLLG